MVGFARVPGAGEALVQRRAMDPKFVEISIQAANRAMLNRAMQLSANVADAEDLVQDIWVGIQTSNHPCLYLEHLLAAVARRGLTGRAHARRE